MYESKRGCFTIIYCVVKWECIISGTVSVHHQMGVIVPFINELQPFYIQAMVTNNQRLCMRKVQNF